MEEWDSIHENMTELPDNTSSGFDSEVSDEETIEQIGGILDDNVSEVILDEDASKEILDEDASKEILDEDASKEILDEDVSEEILDEDALEKILDEDASEVILDKDALEEILDEEVSEEISNEDISVGIIDEAVKNPPNSEVKYYGRKYRTDDNGKLYMYYNKDSREWEMMPETKYESDGYFYETDKKASITRAGGTIRKNIDGRKPLNTHIEGMKMGDERGHIIGDQFGASNKKDNLIPQTGTINRGKYKNFENTVAALRDEGHNIQEIVDLAYTEDPHRPDALFTRLDIDGYYYEESFPNGAASSSQEDDDIKRIEK